MRILWTSIIGIVFALSASGCQSAKTAARFQSAQTNTLTCQQRVLSYKEKLANAPKVQFKNEQNALVYLVVQELAKSKASNDMDACNVIYKAMINADAQKTSGLIRGGFSLGGIGLGLIGLDILTDGLTNRGGTSGDIWNVSGSRVNSKSGNATGGGSGNASSSGDGLGLGNTFNTGDGQGIGGIQPRTTPINGDVSTVNAGSNSGTNEPVSNAPPEAVQVPAE